MCVSTCPTHLQTHKHTSTHTHTRTHTHIHTTTSAPPKHTHIHTITHAPFKHTHSRNHPCTTQANIHTATHAPPKHTHSPPMHRTAQAHTLTFTQTPIHQSVCVNVNMVQFSTNMAQKLAAYLILAKQHLGGQQRGGPFNFIHDRFSLHLHLQQS